VSNAVALVTEHSEKAPVATSSQWELQALALCILSTTFALQHF